ncbi:hypothetical protein SLEP1_g22429 [Rubroshorea leprosula]|uniref:Uncharacterized protein n=1 Tax=Rubroshorea leprosula TaxID=152421 RepID=A0AAV5JGF7_9ROSI|nr:hypothetical protein SLEP1_g22429 [Rubroshorea leprosula]
MCPTQSGVNSENNGHPTSTKESSYASNQLQSMESPLGPSFTAPTMITNEKKGKLRHQQDLQASFNRNFQHVNVESRMIFHDPVIVQKQIHQSEQDEGHSEVEGVSIGVPTELDSSTAQESSCVSSVLDEISLEATSFRQLQHVMEKLDIRTKLCIRDSLYRLARSAEQRHNCSNAKGGFRDGRDPSGLLMAEDTNKCTAFMDMETDTNPIDRSIAHLLFHRPTDPSNDSLRSHAVVHGSVTSPPEMAEKHVSKEEIGGASDKEMLAKDSK